MITDICGTAARTHLCLYYWPELKETLAFLSLMSLKRLLHPKAWNIKFWESGTVPDENQDHYDPHYKLMPAYEPCSDW